MFRDFEIGSSYSCEGFAESQVTVNTELPYFDFLLGRLSSSPELADVFSDHVHWGLFDPDFRGVTDKPAFLNAIRALSLVARAQ